MKTNSKKLALAGVLCAVAVVGSMLQFPVFGSQCAPVQHMVNVICAVFLGPGYGVAVAFLASLLRNIFGLGSLLAFPGSMCGALLCGLVYWKTRNLPATLAGEVFGTGIIGGLLSYPVAGALLGVSGRLHRLLRLCGALPGLHRGRLHSGRHPGIHPPEERRPQIHAGRIGALIPTEKGSFHA